MNVIKQVAKIHNVSEEEVRREIQAVIHAAKIPRYKNAGQKFVKTEKNLLLRN